MKAQGVRSIEALADEAGLVPLTVRRILDGTSGHRALITYKRQADILGWTLGQYFLKAQALDPDEFGMVISSRIKSKGYTRSSFGKKVSTEDNAYLYASGSVKFKSLVTYAAICRVLSITPEELYESLLTLRPVDENRENDRIADVERVNSQNLYTVLISVLNYIFRRGFVTAPA